MNAPMNTAGLDLRGVACRLGGERVLEDISARAERGRLTAVVGPNAAGKSTLLRCVVGVEQREAGEVRLDGTSIDDLRGQTLAARVAFVPQRPIVSAQFTVEEIVRLGARAGGNGRDVVASVLDAMELTDLRGRLYHRLSVGQQQRVSVARALAQLRDEGLLVLDEPTSALDLQHVERTLRVLRQAATTRRAIVVLAIHDLAVAASAADDVWLLDHGRLVAAGAAAEVMLPGRLTPVFGVSFDLRGDDDGRTRLFPRFSL